MTDDRLLFNELRHRLYTAVVGDVMDAIGLHRQFLPPEIRPLKPETTMVGRAMPVIEADFGEGEERAGDSAPFGLMLRALDDLKPGEIYVCTGARAHYAMWGGLMSARAIHLGATGAVCDGFHRDTREILTLDFPLFSRGAYAQDQRHRGRVVDFRQPITFANDCRVAPGDVLFGDADGIVVVPQDSVEEVVRLAIEKVDGESDVRRLIAEGETTEAIFAKTGIM